MLSKLGMAELILLILKEFIEKMNEVRYKKKVEFFEAHEN